MCKTQAEVEGMVEAKPNNPQNQRGRIRTNSEKPGAQTGIQVATELAVGKIKERHPGGTMANWENRV